MVTWANPCKALCTMLGTYNMLNKCYKLLLLLSAAVLEVKNWGENITEGVDTHFFYPKIPQPWIWIIFFPKHLHSTFYRRYRNHHSSCFTKSYGAKATCLGLCELPAQPPGWLLERPAWRGRDGLPPMLNLGCLTWGTRQEIDGGKEEEKEGGREREGRRKRKGRSEERKEWGNCLKAYLPILGIWKRWGHGYSLKKIF